MSLDGTVLSVWQIKRPPLTMLVAGRATAMFAASLPDEARAPFEALTNALEAGWPRKKREPEDIYANEFAACFDAVEAHPAAAPAMKGAYMQMVGLLKVAPRTLPPDEYYQLAEEDFIALLRDAAKVAKLPLAQLQARLDYLLEHQKDKWPDLVARADRMYWGRQAPWGKLDKRVRDLVELADLGAKWSWAQVGTQQALRLELDAVKRIAVLSAEELAALRGVIPAIEEPG